VNRYYVILLFIILLTILPSIPRQVESLKVEYNIITTSTWRDYMAYRVLKNQYYVYATGETGSPYNIYIVIAKPDETYKVFSGTLMGRTITWGEISIDGNDTIIAAAFTAFIASGNTDIYVAFLDYEGNPVGGVVVDSASGYQHTPVIKYGGGYWFVSYIDRPTGSLKFLVYDNGFTNIVYSASISIGYANVRDGDSGIDYRERAFYSTITRRFYQVFYDKTVGDLRLLIVDPIARTHRIFDITNDGTTATECYAYYGRLYRRCYAQISRDEKYIGVIYGYNTGSTNVNFAIIDLSSESIVNRITLLPTYGDTNIFPRVVAGYDEWFISWYVDTTLRTPYVAVVKQDGSFKTDIVSTPNGYEYISGYMNNVFTGTDYVLLFSARRGTDDDLFAIRYTSGLRKSETPLVISNSTSFSENADQTLIIGSKICTLFRSGTPESIAFFDYTEVPEPALAPTQFINTAVIKDTGVDTYLEPGDRLNIIAQLIDQETNNGIPGKTVYIKLNNIIWWDSRIGRESTWTIYTTSLVTNDTGWINVTITIPNNAIEGTYRVELESLKDTYYSGTIWKSPYFIITRFKPSVVEWEEPPIDIATGPAMFIKNGQVLITDPWDEVRTHSRFDTYMTDIIGDEVDDVDITLLQFAVDENYLYIRARFAGNVEPVGNISPVLSIAIDFTPNIRDDGYYYRYTYAGTPISIARLEVVYGMGFTDTYLKENSTWNWLIVATPRDVRGHIFSDEYSRYSIFSWISYKYDTTYYYVEISSGFAEFVNNTITICAPLEVIKQYYPDLFTTSIWSWKIYTAVFAVNLMSGRIIGTSGEKPVPGSNWFDIPGIVSTNSNPYNPIDIGFAESPLDDRIGYDYELDTFFILNLNRTINKFFGYTVLKLDSVEAVYTKFTNPVPYLGSQVYVVSVRDANNTRYAVYGEEIQLIIGDQSLVNSSVMRYGDKLCARIKIVWSSEYLNKKVNIEFINTGSSYYYPAEPLKYVVGPFKYYVTIGYVTVNVIQLNERPGIEAGDIIEVKIVTSIWGDESFESPPIGLKLFKVYLSSTPYFLGYATVVDTNIAILNYTVTGSEWIISDSTDHYILVYTNEEIGYTPYYIEYPLPYTLNMTILTLKPPPVHEPVILPLIILVTLIIIVIFVKRK